MLRMPPRTAAAAPDGGSTGHLLPSLSCRPICAFRCILKSLVAQPEKRTASKRLSPPELPVAAHPARKRQSGASATYRGVDLTHAGAPQLPASDHHHRCRRLPGQPGRRKHAAHQRPM